MNDIIIKPLDYSQTINSTSNMGLSTTFGFNVPFGIVPNASNRTTLFRIDTRNLAELGLKATPITASYWRITPLINMTGRQFDTQIQLTSPLWQPVTK